MQTKRIKCPNCGVVLDVKNSKDETIKQINCPQCKTPLKVTFPPQQEPMEAHTYYAPQKPAANLGATQLAGGLSGATQLVGALSPGETQLQPSQQKLQTAELVFGGVSYPLREGRNIIGRKATTSTATIQIATADRYMSRQHVAITVSSFPDGTLKAVLSNDQNKNDTLVDGQLIAAGDAIRLRDGNTTTMGKTTITFKL